MFARFTKTLGMLTVAAAAACSVEAGSPESTGGSFEPISLPAHEIDLVIEFVNAPTTTVSLLDSDVQLDARAAQNIIAHRNGPDGLYPSNDDNRFQDLEELDAIPFVGDSALRKLREFAIANPPAQAEYVEGVQFTADQAAAVVWGVNHASLTELDEEVGLLRQAAENLIASAPYATVSEMGEVASVGPAALTALRNNAIKWSAQLSQGTTVSQAGTFDGVTFDETTASIALSIANTATPAQLEQGGVYSGGANAILAGRPFTTLAAVSETYGVGPATMQALHDFASSGSFAPADAPSQQQ